MKRPRARKGSRAASAASHSEPKEKDELVVLEKDEHGEKYHRVTGDRLDALESRLDDVERMAHDRVSRKVADAHHAKASSETPAADELEDKRKERSKKLDEQFEREKARRVAALDEQIKECEAHVEKCEKNAKEQPENADAWKQRAEAWRGKVKARQEWRAIELDAKRPPARWEV